jgi:pimeloyl-ACP methyl ester carboxylesterase
MFLGRGVGLTQPRINVFHDMDEARTWAVESEVIPPFNATPDALARQLARSKVYGDLAASRVLHAAQYVTTELVARDMLEIIRAHGRDKLQYWGFSYGSVLGTLFLCAIGSSQSN